LIVPIDQCVSLPFKRPHGWSPAPVSWRIQAGLTSGQGARRLATRSRACEA